MSQQTNRMSIKETHYQKNSFSLSNTYTPLLGLLGQELVAANLAAGRLVVLSWPDRFLFHPESVSG